MTCPLLPRAALGHHAPRGDHLDEPQQDRPGMEQFAAQGVSGTLAMTEALEKPMQPPFIGAVAFHDSEDRERRLVLAFEGAEAGTHGLRREADLDIAVRGLEEVHHGPNPFGYDAISHPPKGGGRGNPGVSSAAPGLSFYSPSLPASIRLITLAKSLATSPRVMSDRYSATDFFSAAATILAWATIPRSILTDTSSRSDFFGRPRVLAIGSRSKTVSITPPVTGDSLAGRPRPRHISYSIGRSPDCNRARIIFGDYIDSVGGKPYYSVAGMEVIPDRIGPPKHYRSIQCPR